MKQLDLFTPKPKAIYTKEYFSFELCDSSQENLFVYGDNLERRGTAGQACIRGKNNTIGLATKMGPCGKDHCYFKDLPAYQSLVDREILRVMLRFKESNYDQLVFPADGLGTGLSELPKRAPVLLDYIDEWVSSLIETNYRALREL